MATRPTFWLKAMPFLALLLAMSCAAGAPRAPATTAAPPPTMETVAPDAARLQVVAAFYPLQEAAERVGGEEVEVYNVTPPGAEAHDLELSIGDFRRIRQADLILYLSRGFQPAIEDAVATAPGESVDVLAGMDLLAGAAEVHGDDEEEGHEEDQEEAHADEQAVDPHVWLDPLRYAQLVHRLALVLAELRPQKADAFRARAEAYTAQLRQLDDEFQQGLADCRSRFLVTNHAAFGYLTQRYGLEQLPISGFSPEAEPTPRKLEEIIDLVREREVRAVYLETLASPKVAETVAREAGVETLVLNPLEGLTAAQLGAGQDYLSAMRSNLEALRQGLDCRSEP